MTIDPRIGMWFSIVMAIVSVMLLCGTEFTTLFGSVVSLKMLAALGILNVVNNAINGVLHMIPSISGPAGAAQFPLGPKA